MSVMLDKHLYNISDISDEELAAEISTFEDITIMMDHPYIRAVDPYDYPITRGKVNDICTVGALTEAFIATSPYFSGAVGWKYYGNRHHCGKWLLCVWLPINKCDSILRKNFAIWKGEPTRYKRYYSIHEFGLEFYIFPQDEELRGLVGEFPYNEFDLGILRKFYRVVPRSIIKDKLFRAFSEGTNGVKAILLSRGDATEEEIGIGLKAAPSIKADIRVKLSFDLLKGMSAVKRLAILELVSNYQKAHAEQILNITKDELDSLLVTSAVHKPKRVKAIFDKLEDILF